MERTTHGKLAMASGEKGIFFRVHWAEAAPFCNENAESRPWGEEDAEPVRGYSCCETADDLRAYFADHGEPEDNAPVVVFWGVRIGTGPDNEPLAVPFDEMRPRWTTWANVATR